MGGGEKTKEIIFHFLGSWTAGSGECQSLSRRREGSYTQQFRWCRSWPFPAPINCSPGDISPLNVQAVLKEKRVFLHQPQMSPPKAAGILMPIWWEFLRNALRIAVGRQIKELVLDLSLENWLWGCSSGFQMSPWESSIISGCPGLHLTSARQTMMKYK